MYPLFSILFSILLRGMWLSGPDQVSAMSFLFLLVSSLFKYLRLNRTLRQLARASMTLKIGRLHKVFNRKWDTNLNLSTAASPMIYT